MLKFPMMPHKPALQADHRPTLRPVWKVFPETLLSMLISAPLLRTIHLTSNMQEYTADTPYCRERSHKTVSLAPFPASPGTWGLCRGLILGETSPVFLASLCFYFRKGVVHAKNWDPVARAEMATTSQDAGPRKRRRTDSVHSHSSVDPPASSNNKTPACSSCRKVKVKCGAAVLGSSQCPRCSRLGLACLREVKSWTRGTPDSSAGDERWRSDQLASSYGCGSPR